MHRLTPTVQTLLRAVSADIILPKYRSLSATEIIEKAPDDLVTVADRAAELALAEGLSALLPDAAIVGEEAVAADPSLMQALGDDLCWIIDPIDGTHNYAHGHGPFGVLIALCAAGETLAGWIYDPISDRLCHAHKGHGAWINGERVRAQSSGQTPSIAAISLLFADPDKRAALQQSIMPHYHCVDIPRCAAEQYPRLVLGINDVSLFERTLPWDHAAGILFLNEAGGMAARPDGTPYRVDRPGTGLIGASSPAIWEAMTRHLSEMR